MRIHTLWALALGSLVTNFCFTTAAHSASATPALLKAKQEAEAKGFIFETSRDEIIAKAKKEGKLRVLSSLGVESLKPVSEAFNKKYPFIDIRAEEIAGTDTYQRMILEMKSGTASGWDVNYMTTDFYDDYQPYQKEIRCPRNGATRRAADPVGNDRSGQSQYRILHDQYSSSGL